MLIAAPQLFRKRGTVEGLNLALDIATDGGIERGDLMVVEDYRLRHTIATILGADLANEHDPLLAGISVSRNSFVGDTLVLGDETKREFLAVFGPDSTVGEEEETIDTFFDELAHRVTILVHDTNRVDAALVRRIIDLETPAHVATRAHTASHPLLVGIASLVGADTYLRDKPKVLPVRVEESRVGLGNRIFNPATLDPRVDGGVPIRPDAGPDQFIGMEESFVLDGSESTGADGTSIVEFHWTMEGESFDD